MKPEELKNQLAEDGILLTGVQESQLKRYYEILVEWNTFMNLTGITDLEQVYLKHFYDSAILLNHFDLKNIKTLCDIGTGAGFPGMVLKIIYPNLQITLVDSLEKRIKFLNYVIDTLNLEGIVTVHARAEEFAVQNREKFDVVTARAVAHLAVLSEFCLPLVKVGGYFVPMKGNLLEEKKESIKAIQELSGEIEKEYSFLLPKEESNRTILKIKKIKPTNKKYPRKFSEIKKKPL